MDIALIILLGVMVLMCIVSFVTSNKKRKEYMEQMKEMQSKFTAGTKVKTYAGIYGEIVSIREALDGSKVATIKSGEGENAMTFDIDVTYISNIDDKDNQKVYDEEYEALKKKMEETAQSLEGEALYKVQGSFHKDEKDKEEDKKEE